MSEVDGAADRDVVARLFALLTARFEDAAAIAATCQNPDSEPGKLHEALLELASSNEEVATLIAAIEGLLRKEGETT